MPNYSIFILILFLFLAVLIIAILDIMKNTKLSNGAKALWIAIILLFQIIGAAIYYLLAPRDNPSHA
ncbi:PLD nuclease N-terminal domain-containing protein [Phocaeicola sp. KGMB11183]|uniref:PLD nuclease N-terminal domain-containing protein n=1 Tax=Phocaeicola acetigenes TaxID=3016083 RepID=A0ABT4PGD5_9BACT|nr:PLD nuclease N-terminal domain-containing protein [Phocaeicola sp. KGMB11183]MCZ8372119.1 PLD nuclease N-terminal domain-containing protein [Phocaeicola sp. KGMB11183]